MSFETYCCIADRIRDHCRYLYLHLWGEPLMNRQIIPMIRHAAEFARVNISTNAITLNESLAKELIESGVSEIIVSVDGMTQEVYETYRRKGDLKSALRGLAFLQKFNLHNQRPVFISPQFIVFRHNQHEMEPFSKFCQSIGLRATFKAPYIRKGSSLQASDLKHLRRKVADDSYTRILEMKNCPNARDVFTILLDGSVVACCYDHNGLTRFGNILENSVSEIWLDDRFSKFRQNLLHGRANPFCMAECLLY
jgi:MoaA/NifB/PqqE/SkfB family radical SAM enzyme